MPPSSSAASVSSAGTGTRPKPFLAVDVNDVVRTAVALTEPRWKAQAQAAGVSIHIETDLSTVPAVDGNVSELRDVLMNLIFNAVDAMPQGGTLRIATRRTRAARRCS